MSLISHTILHFVVWPWKILKISRALSIVRSKLHRYGYFDDSPSRKKSTSFEIFRISNVMAWFECWKRTKIIFHLIWITICSNCQLNFFKFQKRIKKPWQNLEVIQSEWIAGWRKKVSHSSAGIHFLFAFVSASKPSNVVTNFLSHYSVTNLVPNNDKHATLWPLASLMAPFYLSARPFIILLL